MFFPGVFTFDQPWGDDNFTKHLPSEYEGLTQPKFEIPLDENRRVMHITHFDAAEAIIKSGYKVQQKKSEYQYTYVYDESSNSYITEQEKCLLYDGYYSWWSIELYDKEYNPGPLGYDKEYNPGPLGNNDCPVSYRTSFLFDNFSMYGTVKLSLELRDLIKCYAESRGKCADGVCYKVGGTLRYTKEVCYVIIVCVNTDDELSELETSQSLVIKQPYSFLVGVSVSWDHYAFALYYPEQKTLKLGKVEIHACLVEHRGFDSNGSYDERLLRKKTHKCFHILRKKQSECPDFANFKDKKIPIDDLVKLLLTSQMDRMAL